MRAFLYGLRACFYGLRAYLCGLRACVYILIIVVWLESFEYSTVHRTRAMSSCMCPFLKSIFLFRHFDGTVFIGDYDGPITVMDGATGAVTTIEVCSREYNDLGLF